MIIGITGTDGAGKGTVVDYLVKQKGFTHYSASAFIQEEVERQGLPVTRNQLRLTGNELRATHGNEVVIKKAFERALAENQERIIIESIRATAEADFLKQHGGIMLAVDADPHTRYARVQGRRSNKDQVSFEEFMAHEEMEKQDPDPNGMQKAKVMEMADYTISNDGSVKALHHAIEQFIAQYEPAN